MIFGFRYCFPTGRFPVLALTFGNPFRVRSLILSLIICNAFGVCVIVFAITSLNAFGVCLPVLALAFGIRGVVFTVVLAEMFSN